MYIFFSFLFGGIAFMIWITEFDKKQIKKVNTVLRESKSVPPMFMLKSTEHKISKLKAALNTDAIIHNNGKASIAAIYNNNENNKQLKIQDLMLLSAKYNDGLISLEEYNLKLDELLAKISRNGSLGLVG
ncbi:MAG: hypothetical protein JWQ63_2394 [Mucilaginibacter sp.]|jgi:DNA integrity scanning protein DisA with diadenylate cyclase activity|nr:hypothetical protein [Mucilaginibacter sp.]